MTSSFEALISKPEILNKRQILNSNLQTFGNCGLVLEICFELRASSFELASEGGLCG